MLRVIVHFLSQQEDINCERKAVNLRATWPSG